MSIPNEEIVKFLLKEIVSERRIRSQKELSEMLLKKLRKNNPDYSITGKRAREIASRTLGIRVSIRTKTGKMPDRCPVCGSRLRKSFTKNLRGRKAVFRMSCTKCTYTGKGGKWIPSRYEFDSE